MLLKTIQLYDTSETFAEFKLNRDLDGLTRASYILGFIDAFAVLYWLENHPKYSLSSYIMTAVFLIPISNFLIHFFVPGFYPGTLFITTLISLCLSIAFYCIYSHYVMPVLLSIIWKSKTLNEKSYLI